MTVTKDRKARLHKALDAVMDAEWKYSEPPKIRKVLSILNPEDLKKMTGKGGSKLRDEAPKYDASAVQKEINKDKRIGGKETKLIHALLKGRGKDSVPELQDLMVRVAAKLKSAKTPEEQKALSAKVKRLQAALAKVGAPAYDANPFERDTDAGAARIVKREAEAGLTARQIAKKYGFSLSFVEEEMPGWKTNKWKKSEPRPPYGKAKDVATAAVRAAADKVRAKYVALETAREIGRGVESAKRAFEEAKKDFAKTAGVAWLDRGKVMDGRVNQRELPPKLRAAVDAWYKAALEESKLEAAGEARTGRPKYDAVQRAYAKAESILDQAGYTIDSYGVYKK